MLQRPDTDSRTLPSPGCAIGFRAEAPVRDNDGLSPTPSSLCTHLEHAPASIASHSIAPGRWEQLLIPNHQIAIFPCPSPRVGGRHTLRASQQASDGRQSQSPNLLPCGPVSEKQAPQKDVLLQIYHSHPQQLPVLLADLLAALQDLHTTRGGQVLVQEPL